MIAPIAVSSPSVSSFARKRRRMKTRPTVPPTTRPTTKPTAKPTATLRNHHRISARAEPAQAAAGAEVLLLGNEGYGRFLERAGGLRSGKEVDVDATDAARTELDVAGAEPVVASRLLAVL